MIKAMGLLKKKEEISLDEFIYYLKRSRSEVGDRTMQSVGALRYCRRFIKPVVNPYTGEAPASPFDVIVEFWFPDQAAFDAVFDPENGIVAGAMSEEFVADEERFFDREANRLVLVVEEHESDLTGKMEVS